MIFEKTKPNVRHFFVGEERGGELGVLKGSNRTEENHPTAPNISQS